MKGETFGLSGALLFEWLPAPAKDYRGKLYYRGYDVKQMDARQNLF
jgi:hypothetical protein